MKEYRTTKKREEILKHIEKIFLSGGVFTVWQKNHFGERLFCVQLKIYHFSRIDSYFSVQFAEKDLANCDLGAEFYFLINGHDFVFKTKLAIDQILGEYRLQIPKEVRLIELRAHPRKYFELEEKVFVQAYFAGKIYDVKNSESLIEVTCPLLNLSLGGASLLLTQDTYQRIDLTGEVEISGLRVHGNFKPIMKAVVKNARVYSKESFAVGKFYAVGVMFVDDGA